MISPDSSSLAGDAPPSKRTAAGRWPKPSPLCALLAAMLVLGAFLRIYAFAYPSSFLFDEHHFVENARNYLHNKADWNDHPPLGKLIIAQSILALGDNSAGWRVPALIFGFATILVGAIAAARLFGSRRAGWLAAAFLSVDGFLIAYSRGALLDGFLAFGLALALLIVTLPVNLWTVLAAGIAAGFAVSIKFSGIAVVLPCILMLLFARLPLKRLAAYTALFGVAVLSIYFAQYARGLALAGQAAGPLDVVHDTERLLEHHAGLTDMKNPWVSGWITWFIPVRPVMLAHTQHLGASRILTSLGNVALWWSATLTLALTVGVVLAKGVHWMLATPPASDRSSGTLAHDGIEFVQRNGRAILLLLSGCFGFLAPWILTHRDSYIYHYLPSYMSLLLLLAGCIDSLGRSRYRALIAYAGVVLLVAAFYAPVWSTLEISPEAASLRLFLAGWR